MVFPLSWLALGRQGEGVDGESGNLLGYIPEMWVIVAELDAAQRAPGRGWQIVFFGWEQQKTDSFAGSLAKEEGQLVASWLL